MLVRTEQQKDKMKQADDVFVGQITQPQTLKGIADSMDVVFSTVGITRQKEGLTYWDVDYQGNVNLLQEAISSSVSQFLYVSAINGDKLRHLKIFEAKEGFVDELKKSNLDYTVVRPNGFFSDMLDFLNMAKSGRAYLFGKGNQLINPIAGSDLASFCVSLLEQKQANEVSVGGPDIFTLKEIANLALDSWNKKRKITFLPDCVRVIMIQVLRLVTSSTFYGPYEFFLGAMAYDNVAPSFGTKHLKAFFNQQVGKQRGA